MTESLEALLICVRSDEMDLEEASEAAVRQKVINPMLAHLGWNTENVDEVFPEFPIGEKWVDYCLKHQGHERVLIEAKRGGENLKQWEEKLLEYSFRAGVPIAVLTNGMEWWFYLPLKEGNWRERKFFAVDITEQDPSAAAQHLREFLAKEAVVDGSSVLKANEVLDDKLRLHKTGEALPKVWAEMLGQPDDLPDKFFDAIRQRVESACGYQPKREQVVEYLLQMKNYLPHSGGGHELEIVTDTVSKADKVKNILRDGRWYFASELRKRLNVSAINSVLYTLKEEGVVELKHGKKGNEVRLTQGSPTLTGSTHTDPTPGSGAAPGPPISK